jgi:2-hydroxycyclohexanecarboxyl-CoA dehydrogenase
MDLQLRGRTVLITGAAHGIGLATARTFAAEGCSLVLWDLSPAVLDRAQEITRQHQVPATGITVDITDGAQVTEAFQRAVEVHPSVDHIVHCAACGSGKFGFPFTNLQPDDWRRTLDVNIMGMVNLSHATAQHMIQQQSGTYIFLASVAGQIGSQTDPPYSASKAANINFAQCMAKDLAKFGVRVNTICPGMVQTQLNRSVWQAWFDQTPPAEQLSYEDWAGQKIRAIVPLGRWQTPEDIADMIVFLSSPRAKQVTGQTINVDGGFVMHW